MLYYTYMVRCADQSLYTGWTLDVPRRVAAHNDGRGAKYTRSRRPVTLAMHWEWQIKQWTKKKKEKLCREQLSLTDEGG